MKDKYLVGRMHVFETEADYILKCKSMRGNTYVRMTKQELIDFYLNDYMFKTTSYSPIKWSITSYFVDKFISLEEMLFMK